MNKYVGTLWTLIISAIILTACMPSSEESLKEGKETSAKTQLTVSAAASLKSSLEEAAVLFQQEYPDIVIQFNFGGSGSLQQQIEQGAPVDLFFSAAMEPMERLVQKRLIEQDKPEVLLHNRLVLIAPKGDKLISSIQDLKKPEVRVVAIGQPDTVPAGMYGKEVLEQTGLWRDVESKVVNAKDVTQVLSYVETGNADAGFVYASDVLKSPNVRVVEEIDPTFHTPIQYPATVTTVGRYPEEAKKLLDFLKSDEARNIFVKYGFVIPEEVV